MTAIQAGDVVVARNTIKLRGLKGVVGEIRKVRDGKYLVLVQPAGAYPRWVNSRQVRVTYL